MTNLHTDSPVLTCSQVATTKWKDYEAPLTFFKLHVYFKKKVQLPIQQRELQLYIKTEGKF